jgi:hypothetical protein
MAGQTCNECQILKTVKLVVDGLFQYSLVENETERICHVLIYTHIVILFGQKLNSA